MYRKSDIIDFFVRERSVADDEFSELLDKETDKLSIKVLQIQRASTARVFDLLCSEAEQHFKEDASYSSDEVLYFIGRELEKSNDTEEDCENAVAEAKQYAMRSAFRLVCESAKEYFTENTAVQKRD